MSNDTQVTSKTQPICIINTDGVPCVDTRTIAERLAVQHEGVMKNIKKYYDEFQILGILRFEI